MKTYMKRLFTVVFTVLVFAMFSGCTSTTPSSGSTYQGDPSGTIVGERYKGSW